MIGLLVALAAAGPPPQQTTAVTTVLDGGIGAAAQQSTLSEMVSQTMMQLARRHNDEGLLHFKGGEYPAALEAFRQAFEFDPENPEITNNLGFIYFTLGNHERA